MAKTAQSNFNINLSAVAYEEDGVWLAHCLELDIVGEGKDAKEALETVQSLCILQVKTAIDEGDLTSIFRPAPPDIWKIFATAQGKPTPVKRRTEASGKTAISRFEGRALAFA